tara:strand:- start:153 stop:302 length:150 start_codon:yes stop_codon:yes gene_type:complete
MENKILKTKKERLAYIQQCVERGNKKREEAKKREADALSNVTEVDESGY